MRIVLVEPEIPPDEPRMAEIVPIFWIAWNTKRGVRMGAPPGPDRSEAIHSASRSAIIRPEALEGRRNASHYSAKLR